MYICLHGSKDLVGIVEEKLHEFFLWHCVSSSRWLNSLSVGTESISDLVEPLI